MDTTEVLLEEKTLDPANWAAVRDMGHRMLDDIFTYLETVRERPVWKKPSAYATSSMTAPLPLESQDLENVYEEFLTQILPYNVNNIHPRFWAWVQGTGTVTGMLADMLASGMNSNVSIGDHMPMYVEKQVLDWTKEIFGFPKESAGLLTSGASIANITALLAARNHCQSVIKEKGLQAVKSRLVMYGSEETHNCLIKAAEIIGIGSDQFRRVPVDRSFRIRTDLLQELIAEDRKAGHLPFCIIGNAGTVNTGAVDDLDALAELAKKENCWFHVDGAIGAIPKILPEYSKVLHALSSADSLAFDFHKWLYVNYEVGGVLVRNASSLRATFSVPVNYLAKHERGLSGGPDPFSNYGMELSRGFKALKVWMLLKENGITRYSELIRQNIFQARYLGSLVRHHPELELLAEVSLNIVCFRYNPGLLSEERLNVLNKEILMQLHENGKAAPSYTILHGKYAIRVAITNHRSRKEDFDFLVDACVETGRSINSK
jgi:glutamate/tyrosine decarboxylase-like PLP-dependent enzyme